MWKKILLLTGALILLLAGYTGYRYYKSWQEYKVQEESRVLLEKVRTVCKLITVEGQFSEIIDYKDYWGYDLSFFRKKALVRVQATVSVGYDLSNIKVESRPEEKKLLLSQLPDPLILAIDHSQDYYDITEGTFNSFTTEDYNRINEMAKENIREKAMQSELFKTAEQQAGQMLDLLAFMVESAGWTLEYTPLSQMNDPENLLN
jgi:hypothetical protein